MQFIVDRELPRKERVYHRKGCIYTSAIQENSIRKVSYKTVLKKQYCKCQYCSGVKGELNLNKQVIDKWERQEIRFCYKADTDTLYVSTPEGFWKIFFKDDIEKYLLYHLNIYNPQQSIDELIQGDYHRQIEMKATESFEDIIKYIIAHDKAKVIIKDDYRKLPHSSKKEKQYYNQARIKNTKQEYAKLQSLFALIEQDSTK